MRLVTNKTALVFAVFCLVVMVLPQYVKAEVQTQVTEVINLPPATDDNNAVINLANGTIRSNIDTWSPLPQGVFVGGTIEESKMQLNEVPIGESALMITTKISFQASYMQNGASEFIVRLPIYVENVSDYEFVDLRIYDAVPVDAGAHVTFYPKIGYSMPDLLLSTTMPLVAEMADVGGFWNHIGFPSSPIYTTIDHNSWLMDGRLYARVIAPLFSDHVYILCVRALMMNSHAMQIFWQPADLASDGLLSSRVSYIWNTAPDQATERDYPVAADAGWSFVFQKGIGGSSRDWDYFYTNYDIIHFEKYVEISPGSNTTGAFTFTIEFRTNWTVNLVYNLTVVAFNESANVLVLHGPSVAGGYWIAKTARDMIIAANPTDLTYPTTIVNGHTYLRFAVTLNIESAQRMQIMMTNDMDNPLNNHIEIRHPSGGSGLNAWRMGELKEELWFSPWCTITIGNSVFNESAVITSHHVQSKFWSGIGHWWDEHWVDIANVLIIAAGMFLMAVPGGQVFGLTLLAAGIMLFLYDNVPAIRSAIDALLSSVIDGLKWLGNWLWKIGQMIWAALTWLVDQAVYYGSILIGLLVIAVAIALFVGPIYALIKIMGAFLMMAQGDYDKAAAQLSGLYGQGRSAVSTATGGRLG